MATAQKVLFSCTTLAGTGKKGKLTKDENGYYTMPIGGLNVFNSIGDFYTYEDAKQLFDSSSTFMRRVKTGALKGEYGHPKPIKGQSYEEFAERVLTILRNDSPNSFILSGSFSAFTVTAVRVTN